MRVVASRFVNGHDCDEERGSSLGEPVWNPLALLSDLELRLGLPPVNVSPAVRLQSYADHLVELSPRDPFFAASLAVDGLGTSRTLLDWRDGLVESGWDGADISGGGERLAALAAVETLARGTLLPGFADGLARVEQELLTGDSAGYESLQLLEPLEVWPGRWRRIFGQLMRQGCRVFVDPWRRGAVCGNHDLQSVQRLLRPPEGRADECSWKGDGSLVWLRARTAWELAEGVVGFIRQHESRDSVTVRVGDAASLEAALALQGLPSMGHHATTPLRSPLQVLPLALSMSFEPRHPFRALELLTLPDGPFRGSVARLLARALGTAPAVGSRAWRRAKEKIATPRDPSDSAERLRAAARLTRIETWFERPTSARSEGAPRSDLVSVVELVSAWATQRVHAGETESWNALLACTGELRALLEAHPRDRLRPHDLDPLVARALEAGMGLELGRETAGRAAHVPSPHGVMRSRDLVVVWHAGFDASTPLARVPWRQTELRALASARVALPDPELSMAVESAAWRRTVLAARKTLVIATPDTFLGATHLQLPIWDEIVARSCAQREDIQRVTLDVPGLLARGGLSIVTAPRLDLPASRSTWQIDAAVLRSAVDRQTRFSPTAMEALLACPLRWLLDSVVQLRAGELTSLPENALLYGELGHRLAEELHTEKAFDRSERSRELLEPIVDRLLESEAGPLALPGLSAERAQVREKLVRAMFALREFLAENSMTVLEVEHAMEAEWDGRQLSGRLDLLAARADGSEAIIDLKWGTSRYRKALSTGTALQLAVYAETRRRSTGSAATAPAAYFSLKSGHATTLKHERFAGARSVEGPPLADTWSRAARTIELVLTTLRSGTIPVPGVNERAPVLDHLPLAPAERDLHYEQAGDAGCTYCANGALCGRAWEAYR